MATTPKPAAKKTATKAKPKTVSAKVHLDAIAERVTETTNSIMSRVIAKRDAMVSDIDTLHEKVKGTARAADACSVELADIQSRANGAVKALEQVPKHLEARIAQLEERMSALYASDTEDIAGMVGKLVRIKGGARIMVASGLTDDCMMYCVYEEGGKIVTASVPPMALELSEKQA